MKIAIIYDAIYPYVIGGGERRNWEIARRLASDDYKVSLVGMKYWKGHSVITKDNVKLISICPRIPLYNRNGRRSYFEAVYFGVAVFFHLLKNQYDIIDCGNFPYFSCIFARLATFFRKTKFVITWHEIWGKKQWISYAGKFGVIGWLIEKIVSKLSDYNIFVSHFMLDRAIGILDIKRENTTVIPNGVEYYKLRGFNNISAQPFIADNMKKEFQIIYAGRLVEHKGVDILIAAFKDILKKFPDYLLKIVGSGPERKKLELIVKDLGLTDRVLFAGFIERSDLEKEIKKSKIFVLPSAREGMGIVIVESMALGTPVIALDAENSAAKTIIKDYENGVLFRNKEELINGVTKILTDIQLYNSIVENGYKTASQYDWDNAILPNIKEYYKKVLKEGMCESSHSPTIHGIL